MTRVIALPAEPIPVTSTAVRALLPQRRGSEYLAPNVYAHIIQQRLYGAKPDLNWLREQAYPMLKAAYPMSGAASTRRATSPSAGAAIRMLPQRPEFCTIARKN